MPDSSAFLDKFGLKKNFIFNNYLLVKITCKHLVVIPYQQYRYEIDLLFCSKSVHDSKSEQRLSESLQNLTKQKEIVYSRYGNPYICTLKSFQISQKTKDRSCIWIRGIGEATRR